MLQEIIADLEQSILSLDPVEFWLTLTFFTIISLVAFWRMYRWLHHARVIENIPTAKIRSAHQGYIELIGTARFMEGPVIVAPLSRTTCLWYRYKIEEKVNSYRSDGKRQTRWRVVEKKTSEELFLLEDDTGRCVIDPDDADVIVNNKRIWYKRDVIPPRRYTEELITEHEPMYAIGLFTTVANVEQHKIREHVSQLLRDWKQEPNLMLHRYDTDRNGEISPQEWQQAHKDAIRKVKQEHGEREKLEQLSILKAGPHKHQPFILSTEPESKLIRRYKSRAAFAMVGFFFTGVIAVWLFNVRIGI